MNGSFPVPRELMQPKVKSVSFTPRYRVSIADFGDSNVATQTKQLI